jgi:hypothetical protein
MGAFLSKIHPRHLLSDAEPGPEAAGETQIDDTPPRTDDEVDTPQAHDDDTPRAVEDVTVQAVDDNPDHTIQPRRFAVTLADCVRDDPKAQWIIEEFVGMTTAQQVRIVDDVLVLRSTELDQERAEFDRASTPAPGRRYRVVAPRLPPLLLSSGVRVPSGLLNKARYPPLTEEQVISMIYNHPFYQHQVYGVDRSRRDLEFLRSVSHVHGTLRSDRQLTWIDDLRKRAEEAAHFL